MFLRLLSREDNLHLLKLAKLMALADKPLLWDGRKIEELTSDTDLDKLTIQKGEQECTLIDEMKYEARLNHGDGFSDIFGDIFGDTFIDKNSKSSISQKHSVDISLIQKIKSLPIRQAEESSARLGVALEVLRELLEGEVSELPHVPKLMLFELILIGLRSGEFSNMEFALLKEFQHHHQLDDFTFDDLLERAEAMNREVTKTISIILE